MTTHRLVTRRIVLADLGKAGTSFMVFGLAACASDGSVDTTSGAVDTTTTAAPPTTTPPPATTVPPTTSAADTSTPVSEGTEFHRVDLGFVSAYLLYRDGEAVLIDTGVDGSEGAIEAGLGEIGLDWGAVGHIIATHKHPDHIGSLEAVVAAAPDAAVYAGLPDIPAMLDAAQPIPVANGDKVFDLDIIETTGHTAGHISILDQTAGILVAGDALNGVGSDVAGPNPDFTENMTLANASVKTLAQFEYEVALFGHGEPLLGGASQAVMRLAAGIP